MAGAVFFLFCNNFFTHASQWTHGRIIGRIASGKVAEIHDPTVFCVIGKRCACVTLVSGHVSLICFDNGISLQGILPFTF